MNTFDTSSPATTAFSVLISMAVSLWVWGATLMDRDTFSIAEKRRAESLKASRNVRAVAEDCYVRVLQIQADVTLLNPDPPASSSFRAPVHLVVTPPRVHAESVATVRAAPQAMSDALGDAEGFDAQDGALGVRRAPTSSAPAAPDEPSFPACDTPREAIEGPKP